MVEDAVESVERVEQDEKGASTHGRMRPISRAVADEPADGAEEHGASSEKDEEDAPPRRVEDRPKAVTQP